MAWTESTRPRGRFARFADAAKPRLEPVLPQSRLAAASLAQLILVGSLVISFIGGNPAGGAQPFDGLAALALISASIVAVIVVRQARSEAATEASTLQGQGAAKTDGRTPTPRTDLIGDADQLAQLKARVSHELRTPLNAVIGFSELMHREALGPVGNERYREYAGHIRRSAEHFQWATERTLAATEILTSPHKQARSTLQLRAVVLRAFDRARAEAPGAYGSSRTVAIDDQIEVESCHDALDPSLQYLLSAALAISASGLGSGRVAVSSETFECGQVALRVRVPLATTQGATLDGEQAPGAELSLLLAQIGLDAIGASLEADIADGQWQATAWLTQARQREFVLI